MNNSKIKRTTVTALSLAIGGIVAMQSQTGAPVEAASTATAPVVVEATAQLAAAMPVAVSASKAATGAVSAAAPSPAAVVQTGAETIFENPRAASGHTAALKRYSLTTAAGERAEVAAFVLANGVKSCSSAKTTLWFTSRRRALRS